MTAIVLTATLALSAAPPQQASFALVVGVNRSVDTDLEPLRYADDDAARYFDLFGALGARTYLLAHLDDNTRRLHPQAAAEAQAPTATELAHAVRRMTEDVARARARGLQTELYFVYAGHGNMRDGAVYLGLEDDRLTARDLSKRVLERVSANRTHLIVDACYSYFLALGRGPGGQRRAASGFAQLGDVRGLEAAGLLLSTSSAEESHEWEGFQAGVFSHEVRSALYGAADADGDGRVSYREVAAFVQQANRTIPNEKYRPRVFAKPPLGSDVLVDVRGANVPRVIIDAKRAGRYLLENDYGVRLADFHSSPAQSTTMWHPIGGRYYLRQMGELPVEYVLGNASEPVSLASIDAMPPRVLARGAAHDSFMRLFELPFDAKIARAYTFARAPSSVTDEISTDEIPTTEIASNEIPTGDIAAPDASVAGISLRAPPPAATPWTRIMGGAALGVGVGAVATGIGLSANAQQMAEGVTSTTSHADAVQLNRRIDAHNVGAGVLFATAGTALITAAVLWLLPSNSDDP